jgi:hypothetical protein
MAKAGLTLHPEKTRIVDANRKEGFEFLGWHFERGLRWPREKSQPPLKASIAARLFHLEFEITPHSSPFRCANGYARMNWPLRCSMVFRFRVSMHRNISYAFSIRLSLVANCQ